MKSLLLRQIIEGALLLSPTPLAIAELEKLFSDSERPERDQILATVEDIQLDCRDRGYELVEVASGFRFQIREQLASWMHRLWEEKPKRYSNAMLETLALIAYRQPLTRGDIELVRGVAVSSDMIRTLLEREWIKIVGHRDVPGKPALYATTKEFLNYFNLSDLEQLPKLKVVENLEASVIQPTLSTLEGASSQITEN
jgi:segregation and condensation protein B